MGTTQTQLDTGSGVFGFSLAIEGYSYILTDAADTSAVVTAWSGTGWSAALAGLEVSGAIKQQINPISDDIDAPTLTFLIRDCDGNDTFGKDVWKTKPTYKSRLTAVFEPAADGSGTVTVRDNQSFPSSGSIFIGNKLLAYSAKSGTTDFTISAGGAEQYLPLGANGSNSFSRPQNLASGTYLDSAAAAEVRDVHHGWIGRQVALYVHRIVDGVWDARAQARLDFAGHITAIEDGDMGTVVQAQDMRARLAETVILRDQWEGKLQRGIYLTEGIEFYFNEEAFSTAGVVSAGTLTVVTGASGADEIETGRYEVMEFIQLISNWLRGDGTLVGDWSANLALVDGGKRMYFRGRFSTSAVRSCSFGCSHKEPLEFLGFDNLRRRGGLYWNQWQGVDSGTTVDLVGQLPPYTTLVKVNALGATLDVAGSSGTWEDLSAWLPEPFASLSAGANFSFMELDGQLLFGKYASATQLTNVERPAGLFGVTRMPGTQLGELTRTVEDTETDVTIRQVAVLSGKFSTLVPALFASIDGRGINHATHDSLPWGAAIPWDVLGDDFVNSCKAVEEEHDSGSITVVARKPTMLRDILLPEMLMRFAFLIFKDGVYQFVSPPVPSAIAADHTLDETNKGDPGDLASQSWSTDFMVNVVKINFERDVSSGEFLRHLVIRDTTSIDAYGDEKAIEIDAMNSFKGSRASVTAVEELAAVLSARFLPMWGRPLKVVTRSISPDKFGITPGQVVALSDDRLRDPTSGAKGISSRAAIVLSTFYDYGHEGGRLGGEVTLLLTDEDRTFTFSAAAEVDVSTGGAYTDGYDSTNFRLLCIDNAFSLSGADADVTHFEDGDLVRIIGVDPAAVGSPTAWDREVAAVGANYLEFTSPLSSPSWSPGSERYIIIPQEYSACQSSQLIHAYQADDGDGLVEDAADPNSFGSHMVTLAFAAADATTKPCLLPSELRGDGVPLTPAHGALLAEAVNNLVAYKCVPHLPQQSEAASTSNQQTYRLCEMFPFFVGGSQNANGNRVVRVAPRFRTENAATTAYVRVTLSESTPRGTSDPVTFYGNYQQNEWTTTTATYQVGTAYEFTLIDTKSDGFVWISVEIKSSSSSHSCRYVGLQTLHVYGA